MKISISALSCFFAFAVVSFGATVPAKNKDWPQHRGGQDLRGLASGKLGDKLKLLWTFETGEFVKSSAVVSDGRVFIGSDTGKLHAIDLKTGKEAWHYKTELAIEAAPLVVGEAVYVGSTDGFLYALRAKDGKLLWKQKIRLLFGHRFSQFSNIFTGVLKAPVLPPCRSLGCPSDSFWDLSSTRRVDRSLFEIR